MSPILMVFSILPDGTFAMKNTFKNNTRATHKRQKGNNNLLRKFQKESMIEFLFFVFIQNYPPIR